MLADLHYPARPPQILDSKLMTVNRSNVYDYDRGLFLGFGPDNATGQGDCQELGPTISPQQRFEAAACSIRTAGKKPTQPGRNGGWPVA